MVTCGMRGLNQLVERTMPPEEQEAQRTGLEKLGNGIFIRLHGGNKVEGRKKRVGR